MSASTHTYLDHNATTPLRCEARDAMIAALGVTGNANAPHTHGRAASAIVSKGREAVGLAMGVCAQDVIFVGSATEGDNTAIHCAVNAGCKRILISAMDHPATINFAQESGAAVEFIPANSHGQSDMDWLEAKLASWDAADGRPFVSLCAANSETGVIQDTERATELTHAAGGLILIDAVQALGKLRMNFMPDYLVVGAHKIGGPQGIGALYISPDAPFTALITGGGQEKRRRAGTLNVAAIAGFGAAANLCESALDHTGPIRDAIEAGLTAMEPDLVIFGRAAPRLSNVSFFAVPDKASSTLMMSLDLSGVSVSTGTACSSGKVGASRAVTAMGRGDQAPMGAIRVSLGYTSTLDDAEIFLKAWAKVRGKEFPIRTAA